MLAQVPATPPCETTVGLVAIASTSSTAAGDTCARSTSTPRSCMRRTSSRPLSVRPPLWAPCADPANSLSKKCVNPIMRKPRAKTTSRFATSPSSACAPSIPSSAPIGPPARCPPREQGLQIGARAHGDQRSLRARDGALETVGLQLRASERPAPGERRELRHAEQRQQIEGVARIAFDVETEGHDGHDGEELQPDAALLQPRQIDVTDAAPLHEVTAGEQRIGVHVGDQARRVERTRGVRYGRQRHGLEPVQEALDDRAHAEEHDQREHAGSAERSAQSPHAEIRFTPDSRSRCEAGRRGRWCRAPARSRRG